jgi:reactive intermediate/imine deaminase
LLLFDAAGAALRMTGFRACPVSSEADEPRDLRRPCCGAAFYTRERGVTKQAIHAAEAPQAIGTYSQAIRSGNLVFLSGQIGLDPKSMRLVEGVEAQIHQVFRNLRAVAAAAGAQLDDAVKLTVFLTDLAHFARLNEIMAEYFGQPYPARSALGVAQLPRGALVEVEAILAVS